MSNVTIRKFPVTAPDGTEYRVKIDEINGLTTDYTEVSLYLPRKRFGYRLVYRREYKQPVGTSDYIALATELIRDYYENIEWSAEHKRKRAESILRKQAAVDRFAEWDGNIGSIDKITEVSE